MAANGYQKHILIGNLGADPKVYTTQNGNTVTNFDIAVNERNADGTEIVTWYGIAAWNGLGEVCAQYLKKGRQVMVEGTRLEVNAWMGRDGNLYTKMELTANEIKFLGGNGDGNGGDNGGNGGNGGNARGPANNTGIRGRTTGSSRTHQTRRLTELREDARKAHQQQAPSDRKQSRQQQASRRQQAPRQEEIVADQYEYIPDNPEDIPF